MRDRPTRGRAALQICEIGGIESVRNDHESFRRQRRIALAELLANLFVHRHDPRCRAQAAALQALIDAARPLRAARIEIRPRPGIAEIEHQRKLELPSQPRSQPVRGERWSSGEDRFRMPLSRDSPPDLHSSRNPSHPTIGDEDRAANRASPLLAPGLSVSLHRLDVDRPGPRSSRDATIQVVEFADRAAINDRFGGNLRHQLRIASGKRGVLGNREHERSPAMPGQLARELEPALHAGTT